MKKSELKNGCVVELRNGNKGIKIDNILLIVYKDSKSIFGWLKLNDYNDDLTFASNDNDLDEYDIVKVDNDVTFDYSNVKYCVNAIRNHFTTTSTKADKWSWKRKEDILTDKEREYLKAVIEPVKDKVKFIQKIDYSSQQRQYIYIGVDNDDIALYSFEANTQFRGMELDKEYTLEDLGLE